MAEAFVFAILLVWFVLSVLNQLPLNFSSDLRGKDSLKLIPRWVFFAPNPFDTDLSIIYRIRRPDGTSGGWREIEWIRPRRCTDFLWNPLRRRPKSLIDLLEYLRSIAGGEPSALTQSSAYLTILEIVANHHLGRPEREDGTHIQFAVVRTCRFEPLVDSTLLLRSGFHAICAR